jgi:hypothetical protein
MGSVFSVLQRQRVVIRSFLIWNEKPGPLLVETRLERIANFRSEIQPGVLAQPFCASHLRLLKLSHKPFPVWHFRINIRCGFNGRYAR